MKWGTATLLSLAGIAVLAGWLPGMESVETGPRVGIGLVLLTFGLLIFAIPATTWILKKTTRPADYKGTCPAGESCQGCGAFNLKPRQACRSCGAEVNQASEAL